MKNLYKIFSVLGALAFVLAAYNLTQRGTSTESGQAGHAVVSEHPEQEPEKQEPVPDTAGSNDECEALKSDFDRLSRKHRILKNNIIALKSRVAALEAGLAYMKESRGAAAKPGRTRMEDTELAEQRRKEAMARDEARYSPETLRAIEEAYGKAMKNIKTPEGQKALMELYDKYPDSNRGGCAAMNLATELAAEGRTDEASALLDRLIDNESGSVFGNGVKILPKALFSRAKMAKKQKDSEAFDSIRQTIKESFPDEKDNNGKTFSSMLDQMDAQNND